jgi:hypothetical protein
LTINLNANARTQTVQNQCLLGFGQSQFPRCACMLDGGLW